MIVLVIGPESTGTRAVSRALGAHPALTSPQGKHDDPLDDFWQGGPLPKGDFLTRRSVPAGVSGKAARPFTFPTGVSRLAATMQDVRVVVTARAPWAAVASAAETRASVRGDRAKAEAQYQWAYRAIFASLREDWPLCVAPVEALYQHPGHFVRGVWEFLRLPDAAPGDLSWVRDPSARRL